MPPAPRWIPLLLVLLLVSSTPSAVAAALEKPDLRPREYWNYDLLDRQGQSAEGNGTATIEVEPGAATGRVHVVTATRFNQSLRNGSFEVEGRTSLEVDVGDLGVEARESVTVRNGTFQGRQVWSYTRNITRYDDSYPLVPAPSNVGDVWRPGTRARSVVNQTSKVGGGEDADTVTSGPTRYNLTVNGTLAVEAVENVTVPAGTFESVRVNRTRTGQPGYTLEWWAAEPDYMVRWATYGPNGSRSGGADLTDWGRYPAPAEPDDFPWRLVAAGGGAALLLAATVVAWRRRG